MKKTLLTAAVSLFALLAPLGVQGQVNLATAQDPGSRLIVPERVDADAMGMFTQVLNRIRSQYVDQVSDRELIEAAISGMMSTLDQHSKYLDANSYKSMRERTSGEFGGLGVQIKMEEGLLKVVSPIEGSPADRAGLKAGDYIVAVGGASIQGLSLEEASKKLRGPVGSSIALTVRRGDQAFPVSLVRDVVKRQSVTWEVEGSIGVVRINHFDRQTQPGLEAAMRGIHSVLGDGVTGYLLDLRNNPGGLLRQGVYVADSFLDSGTIVSTKGRGGRELEHFVARPGDLARGKPLVVLVNSGSASASEIVAGALQDHGRAVILGTQSYGKGSVQTIMPIRGADSAIKMTTARYYTPSGRSIHGVGVTPDVPVEQTRMADASAGKDASPDSAVGNGSLPSDADKVSEAKNAAEPEPAENEVDYQRQKALELLSGVSAANAEAGRTSALQPMSTAAMPAARKLEAGLL